MSPSPTGSVDLEERVRRLEENVALLQARLLDSAHGAPVAPVAPPVAPRAATDDAAVTRTDAGDLETRLATYWLGRAGIVALVTGIAAFITLHFGDFGVIPRVLIGYSGAALLAGAGVWFSRRYTFFGQLVFGGGLAVAYFVTYALHFIESVRVVQSELLGLALLALMVVGIVAGAQRFRSETVAGVGLFLGFHTSIVGETTIFGLAATWLLAAGAVYFLLANRWTIIPISSVVAVYASHVISASASDGASLLVDSKPAALDAVIVVLYFVAFSVPLLVRPAVLPRRFTVAFALTNVLGCLGIAIWQIAWTDPAYLAPYLASMTVLLGGGAAWAHQKRARLLLEIYGGATILVVTGLLSELCSGSLLVVGWSLIGGLAVLAAHRLWSRALQAIAVLVLCLAAVATFVEDAGLFASVTVVVPLVLAKRIEGSQSDHPLRRLLEIACLIAASVTLSRALSIALPSSMTTLAWAGAAFVLVAVGMALRDRGLRYAGLAVLAGGILRLFFRDLSGLPTDARILTFVLLGVVMLALSFAYTRLRDRLAPRL